MKLGQATFVSDSTIKSGQVELVARSHDIDGPLISRLAPWAAGFWEIPQPKRESINFFRPASGRMAVSRNIFMRTGFGHTESVRCVTPMVVFEPKQLSGFHDNVVLFLNAIRTLGALILEPAIRPEVPLLNVPDRSILKVADYVGDWIAPDVAKVVHAIDIHRQVAILGELDPLKFLCSFLSQLPPEQRFGTSFSTGLAVSDDRPFNLHFFPAPNPDLKKELVQAQVRAISVDCQTADSTC